GMAVKDPNLPHGLRLVIEDYPYAVDSLEIWSAIKSWVEEYCSFYYETDSVVQKVAELQSWWKELREKGHGDKKDEPWWPKMQTHEELVETCTIIIWIASALRAAVNFGQYPYAGYLPNRPTISRGFMPEVSTPEYEELKLDLDKRDNPEWTFDTKPLEAFERFGKKLAEIEDRIMTMNNDKKWKNRAGPVKVPFTLLYPTSEGGLTGMGISNSVSI
ncbi:putative linoleate 9s-lipoxygenase 5, partial [Quercus suber]